MEPFATYQGAQVLQNTTWLQMVTKGTMNSPRPERRRALIAAFDTGDRASEAFVPQSQTTGDIMIVTILMS